MPFILEQRRLGSPLPIAREWSECAGSKEETEAAAEAHRAWWEAYDAYYSLIGWEYRVRKVKK